MDGSWRPGSTVGAESVTDRKEHALNKALSIALAVVVALVAATSAVAGAPPDAFERAVARNAAQQPGGPIQAQELGRRNDPRLTYAAGATPVLIAGAPDGFDARDAVIGGGAGFALALLGMAGVAYGVTRRSRAGLSAT